MEHIDYNILNTWCHKHVVDESIFDDDGFIIMENMKNYKVTGVVAQIFEDHKDNYIHKYGSSLLRFRPNAITEIDKIINCANHNLGATVYACPICDDVFFCHHTCKGKLCSSCGVKTQKRVTENILQTCINTSHRHITFTIPNILTNWFFDDLYSLNILFDAVKKTIYSVVNGKIKKKIKSIYDLKWKPAFFSFLHTFGRPLNFNPHIHVVFAEYLMDNNGITKKIKYLDYNALSKRFMLILLNDMEKYFGKDKFSKIKNEMYLKYKNGFYVNNRLEDDGIKFNSIEDLIKYVTRYCARPAMAESRIKSYDGNNVTFYYVDHKTNKYHEETVSAFEFITRILRHLLPNRFMSIRSYGLYNKKSKIKHFSKLVSKEKQEFRKNNLKWSNSILISFKRIPIMCEHCNTLMEPLFEVSR